MKNFMRLLSLLLLVGGLVHAAPGGITTTFGTVGRACEMEANVVVFDPELNMYESSPQWFRIGVDNFVEIDDVIPGEYYIKLTLWTFDTEATSDLIRVCMRFFAGDDTFNVEWPLLENVPYMEVLLNTPIVPSQPQPNEN